MTVSVSSSPSRSEAAALVCFFDATPPGRTPTAATGALAYGRDLGDVLGARYGRNVTRYDRAMQTRLAQGTARIARPIVAGVVTLAVAWLVLRLVRARRTHRKDRARRNADGSAGAPAEAATRLYLGLEDALAKLGIARDRALPPLAHAEALVAIGHPVAREVLALTNVYLAARFGAEPLDETAQRDFEARGRAIVKAEADGAVRRAPSR